MNTESHNYITELFFNNTIGYGTSPDLPDDERKKMKDLYISSVLPASERKRSYEFPLKYWNITLVDVLPVVAITTLFVEKLDAHAEDFCESINTATTHNVLENMKEFKSLENFGDFINKLIQKHKKQNNLTRDEIITFKYYLTGILKMNPSIDANSALEIVKSLNLYTHPDKCFQSTEVYRTILHRRSGLIAIVNNYWGKFSITKQPTVQTARTLWQKESRERVLVALIKCSNWDGLKALMNRTDFDDFINVSNLINEIKMTNLDKFFLNKEIAESIRKKRTLRQKKDSKETLLMALIKCSNWEGLQELMNRADFDTSQLIINGETPLIYAIKQGSDDDTVSSLLIYVNNKDQQGNTPLKLAIISNIHYSGRGVSPYREIIASLLKCKNIKVDEKDCQGMTVLYYLANKKKPSLHFDVIKELISAGANIDHKPDGNYPTARTLLGEKLPPGKFEEIEILADNLEDIRNGTEFPGDDFVKSINDFEKSKKVSYALLLGRKKIAAQIPKMRTLRQKISCRETVLMALIKSSNVDGLEKLMERTDFDDNQLTSNGETPLIYAIQQESPNIVRFLLENEMHVNSKDQQGNTPLKLAIIGYTNYSKFSRDPYKNPYRYIIDILKKCKDIAIDDEDRSALKNCNYSEPTGVDYMNNGFSG